MQGVIFGKVGLDIVIYSNGWRGYNGLVDVGYAKHFKVNHGNNEFAHGYCHINGIESFWSFTKRRLAKFNGVAADFELHLKECEWRWNQNPDDLQRHLWDLIKRFYPSYASLEPYKILRQAAMEL